MRPIEMNSPDAELAAGDPALREADGSLPMMQEIAQQEPGAVSWTTVSDLGTVPAGSYRLLLGEFSPLWTGPSSAGRLRLQRAGTAPQPPPPPPVVEGLTGFSLATNLIQGTGVLSGTLTRGASGPTPLTVTLTSSSQSSVSVPTSVVIPAGSRQVSFSVTVMAPADDGGSYKATLRATTGVGNPVFTQILTVQGKPLPLPPPTPSPEPAPGPLPVERVVNLGGMSQPQIQAAIDAAAPGTGLYLPAGLYSLRGVPRVSDGGLLDFRNKQGVTFYGDGPATVVDFGGLEGIWLRPSDLTGPGNCIRDMTIQNVHRGVCALDPQRLWVQRVRFSNVGIGYASERTGAFDNAMFEWMTVLEDCQVLGWSGHGMMLHGGETVERCQLIDTPGNQGSTYSHGLYLQGCRNVTITDLAIENTSGHSFQIYSDSAAHQANGADRVVMRRITCRNCHYGPVWAANGPYTNLVLENLTVVGTVSREAGTLILSGTNDFISGARMKNIVLDGGGEGLVLQGGATGGIRDLQIDGLTIRNHSVGIRVSPSDWPYTKIESSAIRSYQTSGVAVPVAGSSPGLVIS